MSAGIKREMKRLWKSDCRPFSCGSLVPVAAGLHLHKAEWGLDLLLVSLLALHLHQLWWQTTNKPNSNLQLQLWNQKASETFTTFDLLWPRSWGAETVMWAVDWCCVSLCFLFNSIIKLWKRSFSNKKIWRMWVSVIEPIPLLHNPTECQQQEDWEQ